MTGTLVPTVVHVTPSTTRNVLQANDLSAK